MRGSLKVLLPILVIAVAVAGATAMILARPQPEVRVPEPVVPLVRVQRVELRDVRFTVSSQGTEAPRTESVAVPEVSGRIVEVSPSFVPGGFFEQGDLLVRIDPHDYRQARIHAESRVAQAQLRLALVEAEAEVARQEWDALGGGEATPLTLHEPQVAGAEAALAAAGAALVQAERDLEHTVVRAPYAGRVRNKQVDLGQFVNRGAPLATIYAVDFAEVRLPLPDSEIAFLDLPLGYRGEGETERGPEVVLTADFAGKTHEWHGRIVRTEGVIDPKSRMVHAVARVEDPYGHGGNPERPPLAVGMYVQAEILGREVVGVAVLPRAALRDGDHVLVVDADDRLRIRRVEVERTTRSEIVIRSGLKQGERVCLTALAVVTDGMRVRTADGGV